MTSEVKGNLVVAVVIGGVAAWLTTAIEQLAHSPLVWALTPGLIGSMAIAGNIHAFPLWPAACINFVFCFLLVLSVGAIVRALRGRRHSQIDGSTGDNPD